MSRDRALRNSWGPGHAETVRDLTVRALTVGDPMTTAVDRPLVELVERRGVSVVAVNGALDAAAASQLSDLLERCDGKPVVIDLDHCALIDPAVLAALDARRWDRSPEDTCLVSSRSTARTLLVRHGLHHRFAVFQQCADAIQAHLYACMGHGPGWLPPGAKGRRSSGERQGHG